MPFTSMCFLKALKQGLDTIASDVDLWLALFPPQIPQALAERWFGVFAPSGESAVVVLPIYRGGAEEVPPLVIVRTGPADEDGTPMGYDSVTPDLDGEVDSYGLLRERTMVSITTIAKTPEMTAAIHAACQAAVLDNIRSGWFSGQGIRGITPAGSGDYEPDETTPNELLGTFMMQGTWHVREDIEYPRLIASLDVGGEVGVTLEGYRDINDAPGRASIDTGPPELIGTTPISNAIDVNRSQAIELRFSRRMDATTLMAAVVVSVDGTPVATTMSLTSDPPTNRAGLRENRLRVRPATRWPANEVVQVSVAASAASDTGVELRAAAVFTFTTAG